MYACNICVYVKPLLKTLKFLMHLLVFYYRTFWECCYNLPSCFLILRLNRSEKAEKVETEGC